MAKVEIFTGRDELKPFLVGAFDVMPRTGEYLSIEADGYFHYYHVREVWFRREENGDTFQPCLRVELDD
jgi:hypothetical protein